MISPGKVGLTAMHGLAYGVPIITHGNFDNQMPESEAIQPGVTGDFFEEDSVESLAAVIARWIEKPRLEDERIAAISEIEARYTPQSQARAFEAVLLANGLGS